MKRILFLGAILLIALSAVLTALGLAARPEKTDLAVVLGNEVMATGVPSKRLQARLDCAINLYRQHLVFKILVSGGPEKTGFDEGTVMADYLNSQGVPRRDILVDSVGVNSRATAVNTQRIMRETGLKTVTIVTQYFHIPRCELAFRQAGIPTASADYPRYFEWGDLPSIVREAVGILAYGLNLR